MTSIPGVDYAWAPHPSPAALRAAGKRFAARYSSTDPSKDLTPDEAAALAAAGIWSVLVRESTAKRAAAGRAAGAADARAALRTADAAGMPGSRPIYFAVDFDAEPLAVVPYFQGVASVIGVARTGVYGGYRVVKYLLDHGLATWAWQTTAWSAGQWDPRANIRQGGTTRIGGADCDLDTALTSDYGQWMPGRVPEEDELTPDQIYAAVWRTDAMPAPADRPDIKTNPTWQPESVLTDIQGRVRALTGQLAAQTAAVTALAQQVGTGRDVDTIVAAVQEAVQNATVHVEITGATPKEN